MNTHSPTGTPNPVCAANHPRLTSLPSNPGPARPVSSVGYGHRFGNRLAQLVSLVVLFFLLSTAAVANGTGQVGNFCAGQFVNPANCTANDVLFEEFDVVEVVESCTQGVPGEAEVIFDAIVVSNAPNRYGIGMFINLEGTSAISGDLCLHDFLSPVNSSTDPADWPTEIVNGGSAFVAPFPNINADQCGDIPGNSRVLKRLQQVRIQCADQNNDGFVDLSACASWENNANAQCNSLNQAVPGTPSKCGCTTVTTELAMPAQLTIRKETTDGDDTFEFETTSDPMIDQTFSLPSSFSITTSGGEGSEDFGGFVEPGTYTIDEIVPAGWNLASANCTNGDDPQAAGGGVTLAPGDDVTCTFVNSPVSPGTITITKSTLGDDGTFQFTGDLGSFQIATTSGSGSSSFTDLTPGTYAVTETVPSGWTLTNISCQSDAGSGTNISGATATIDLAEGGNVSCTFTNARHGTIVVEKTATPDDTDQLFSFSSNFAGDFNLGAGENLATHNLQPSFIAGAYSVSESVPDGWTLVSATCDGGNSPDNINLQPGQTVTCTFDNAIDRGTIVVQKTADPSDTDQQFSFSSNFAGDFTIGAGENLSTGDLLPSSEAGTYSVSETVPDGWTLVSATCDGGHSPENIDLQAGETVTCTFDNAIDRGTIVVEKIADPSDSDQQFSFSSNFAGDFTIGAGGSLSTGNLLPSSEAGTYSVSETVPDGWDLVSATCDGGNNPQSIDLQAGETVTCTFTNVERASLTVRKIAIGGDDVFDFSSDALGDGTDPLLFSIDTAMDDPPEATFGNLEAGTYDVTEHLGESDWILLDSFCNIGQEQIVVNEDGTIIVDILPGQHVTCTFENALPGTVSLTKSTIGGDGEFEFTFEDEGALIELFTLITDGGSASTEFTGIEPGVYTFTETDLPERWELTDLYCTQIDAKGNETTITGDLELGTVTFELAFGDTIGCLFENTRDGEIVVRKVTVPSGSNQLFEFVGPEDSALNTLLGDGDEASDHFQPGSYTISEVVPEGWANPTINCDGGVASSSQWIDGSALEQAQPVIGETVNLAAGETVICTFTNTQLSSIAVVKQTIPEGSPQLFEFTGDLSGTIGDGEMIMEIDVPAGIYTSTELVPDGWALDAIECEGTDPANVTLIDGGDGVSVALGEGENVTCTFTNRELEPGIELTKTDGGIIVGQGLPLVYTLNYSNTGELDLTDVVITETVPENTTFDAAGSTAGWTCADGSEAGTICELSIDDLATGASGSVEFGLIVGELWAPDPETGLCGPPPESPQVDNTASIVGTSVNGDADDEDSDTTPVTVDCDDVTGLLTIEKVVSSGDQMQTFEFTGSDATDGFDSFSLAHGESQSFSLPGGTYSVSESVPDGWALESTECTGDNTIDNIELGPQGNVTCTFTNRELEPGISIVKSYTSSTVIQGGSLVFLLTYQNTGNVDLTDVSILETIPANTSFNAATPYSGAWACSGDDCLHEVGDLAAGESGEVRFPLTVDMVWIPDPITGLCGPAPQDPRVDNTADIIGTSSVGDVSDSDDLSIAISAICQDQPDEPEIEPIPVPVTTPTGLAALALLMMVMAQLVLYRRRKQVRRN